jgi:hypothetical protein
MRSIITGVVAAIILAVGAAFVLEGRVQKGAERAFHTEGVRL